MSKLGSHGEVLLLRLWGFVLWVFMVSYMINSILSPRTENTNFDKTQKNGVHNYLMWIVNKAFKQNKLVRIDCKGLSKSDYKNIGEKLSNMLPCILVTFDHEQIVSWRGKNHVLKSMRRFAKLWYPVSTAQNISFLWRNFHWYLYNISQIIFSLRNAKISYSSYGVKFVTKH